MGTVRVVVKRHYSLGHCTFEIGALDAHSPTETVTRAVASGTKNGIGNRRLDAMRGPT
jgi:hypothetical protein